MFINRKFYFLQLRSWRKIDLFLLWALFLIQPFQITIKWGNIEQFSMFFLNKIDCLDHMLHGSNITNLNHYTASLFQMRKRLLHCACISLSDKHKQNCSKSLNPASKCDDFKQREILWLEKLILISPARTVTICDVMHTSNSDLHITHWEKLTFNQSFVSKYQLFLFENCCLDNKKEDQRSWGQHLKKFWSGEQKRNLQGPKSKTQTTCNMAVIEKEWLFNVPPLFNVAPLDNSLLWILWFSSILLFRLIKKNSWKPLFFIYHLPTGNL